ncbi:MAG: methyltransferase domain-containing protein [Nitrospinae bacterium]|nr:methyltransferase domain-containing protein [Nitrospinota bacterium]
MKNLNCPLCRSASGFETVLRREQWSLRLCGSCGLYFVYPFKEIGKEFYNDDYYRSWGSEGGRVPEHVLRLKEKNMRRHLEQMARLVPRGKILEVGCAMGSFLQLAQKAGYDVTGIDLSEQACATARSAAPGGRIVKGYLENVPFEKNSFDAIFLSDLLEHVARPAPFLQKAVDLLKPGGIVYIVTPNPDHWSRRLFGGDWVHFKDEHLMFYPKKTFRWMEREYGLKLMAYSGVLKRVNLNYLATQLEGFGRLRLGRMVRFLNFFLPASIKEWLVPVGLGEARAILQKTPASASAEEDRL